LLRAALQDQGWREGDAVTAVSDGDPALPALLRSATAGPVEPMLDWFHLSMRVSVGALRRAKGMVGCPSSSFFWAPDAAQAQRRSPPPHPEDVVQGAELAGI